MPTLKAEFDGRVFVPCTPVDLAAGAKVEIILSSVPEKLTPQKCASGRKLRGKSQQVRLIFPRLRKRSSTRGKGHDPTRQRRAAHRPSLPKKTAVFPSTPRPFSKFKA